jgi:DNA-binding GntR family transcriptional regulator
VLEAIRRRDDAGAERAMREHVIAVEALVLGAEAVSRRARSR